MTTATRGTHLKDVGIAGLLLGLGIAQAEFARHAERFRRWNALAPHINMTSVWTFAAVLLLPVALITALVALLYVHLALLRARYRLRDVSLYRTVSNTALATLTCLATRAIIDLAGFDSAARLARDGWVGFLIIALGLSSYFVVGAVIVAPAMQVRPRSWAELFGTWADNVLEFATICLGAIAAVLVVTLPQLTIAVVPALLLLQRSVLVGQLEVAATTDDKTGVFNTVGWHHIAKQVLLRAARSESSDPSARIGVLMIDLDRFKAVNDRYGHLDGDRVLKAVAGQISEQVRPYDSVARFGGEEFVVLLPGTGRVAALDVAERVRAAVTTVEVPTSLDGAPATITGLTVSIGVAMYPDDATDIDGLLLDADTALYRAKTAGRNLVEVYSRA